MGEGSVGSGRGTYSSMGNCCTTTNNACECECACMPVVVVRSSVVDPLNKEQSKRKGKI